MLAEHLQEETTEVLQQLVRFNTVNPPGNERPAIEYLASYLQQAGLQTELLGAADERPNLVADLRGSGDGPTLCYLGHVDTVLADASEWAHDPWSGDVADGFLWGDYEGLTAMGNTFYGVFTGESIGRSMRQLDPIFFRESAEVKANK